MDSDGTMVDRFAVGNGTREAGYDTLVMVDKLTCNSCEVVPTR